MTPELPSNLFRPKLSCSWLINRFCLRYIYNIFNSLINLNTMILELFWGLITALLLILLAPFLQKYFPMKLLAATILVAIAFIYVGFALKEDSLNGIVIEVIAALVFYFMAVFGYAKNSRLIAVGILLHGIWDILHHFASGLNANPEFWPVYCLTIDVIWSIYFYRIFKNQQ